MELTDPVVWASVLMVALTALVFGYLAFKVFSLMNKDSDD